MTAEQCLVNCNISIIHRILRGRELRTYSVQCSGCGRTNLEYHGNLPVCCFSRSFVSQGQDVPYFAPRSRIPARNPPKYRPARVFFKSSMHPLVPDNRPLLYLASIVSFSESSSNSGATSYPRTVGTGRIPSLRCSQSSVGTTEKTPLSGENQRPKTEFVVQMDGSHTKVTGFDGLQHFYFNFLSHELLFSPSA